MYSANIPTCRVLGTEATLETQNTIGPMSHWEEDRLWAGLWLSQFLKDMWTSARQKEEGVWVGEWYAEEKG